VLRLGLPLLAATLGAACGSTRTGGGETCYDPGAASSIAFAGSRQDACEQIRPLVREAAGESGVDEALLMGIIRVESNFNQRARSSVGAMGLMQLMPATAKGNGCNDPWDAAENVRCGARVLAKFVKRYDGQLIYALSAYHAGYRWPSNARDASRLPKNFSYVEKVLMARSHYLRKGCSP
jgi:soluble lytic murein transglycosylase-like protein